MAYTTYALPPQAGDLAGRISQARKYSGLKQAELILRVGVDRKTLSSWENRHTSPTVDQLVRVAQATGFSIGWFVDGLDDPDDGPDDGGPGGSRTGRLSTLRPRRELALAA